MTDKQRQASRTNGSRSRGPVTPEGKARSAMNALKHGLFSETTLLEGESLEQFEALRDDYLDLFQPAGVAERAAVNDMITAVWRMRRIRWLEQAEFELTLWRREEEIDEDYPGATGAQRVALAHEQMSTYPMLDRLERQELRLARLYAYAERRLAQLRAEAAAASAGEPPLPDPEPSDPKPPEPPASEPQAGPQRKLQNLPGNDLKPTVSAAYGQHESAAPAPAAPPAAPSAGSTPDRAAPSARENCPPFQPLPHSPLRFPPEPVRDLSSPIVSHAAARHYGYLASQLWPEIRQALAQRGAGPSRQRKAS